MLSYWSTAENDAKIGIQEYQVYVPCIYKNLPTNQGSPKNPQYTMWLNTYRKQKTGKFHLGFPRYWGSFW